MFEALSLLSIIIMLAFMSSGSGSGYLNIQSLGRAWKIYALTSIPLGCVAIVGYVLMLRGKKVGFYLVCGLAACSAIMGMLYYASAGYSTGMIVWIAFTPIIGLLIIWLFMRKQWIYFS